MSLAIYAAQLRFLTTQFWHATDAAERAKKALSDEKLIGLKKQMEEIVLASEAARQHGASHEEIDKYMLKLNALRQAFDEAQKAAAGSIEVAAPDAGGGGGVSRPAGNAGISMVAATKVANATAKAVNEASAAMDRYGKQKTKYNAFLDTIRNLISVTGTGAGYINQLSWLIDMQNKAIKKGDFFAATKWQRDIDVVVAQMQKWLLAFGIQFDLRVFEDYKKMGGKPETQGLSVSGVNQTNPLDTVMNLNSLKSTGELP